MADRPLSRPKRLRLPSLPERVARMVVAHVERDIDLHQYADFEDSDFITETLRAWCLDMHVRLGDYR